MALDGDGEELRDPLMTKLRAWKKLHYVGRLQMKPADMLPPPHIWGARGLDEDHVGRLMEGFHRLAKVNARGISVHAASEELWNQWSVATVAEKKRMWVEGSKFRAAIEANELRCPKGGHTSEALRRLIFKYPNVPLYQVMTKGIKVYVSAETQDDIDNLRYMGNIDNFIAGLQKSTDFCDQMFQLHNQHVAELEQYIAKGSKGPPLTKKDIQARNVVYIEQRAAAWNTDSGTLRARQGLANMVGKEWLAFNRIMNGQYKNCLMSAEKQPLKLTTHSQFSSLMTLEPSDRMTVLNKVLEGDLPVAKVRVECLRVIAYDRLRSHVVGVIMDSTGMTRKEQSSKEKKRTPKNWLDFTKSFPSATEEKFLAGWLPTVLNLKKSTPFPPAFSTELMKRIQMDDGAKDKAAALVTV
jgi:hypothetical protein